LSEEANRFGAKEKTQLAAEATMAESVVSEFPKRRIVMRKRNDVMSIAQARNPMQTLAKC
jgi:hypothetical protein